MGDKRPSTWRAAWTAGRLAGRRVLRRAVGERDLELGELLTGQLDQMKGLAMKVGQIVSYLDVPLPPEVQAQLARLQTGQHGAPAEVVRAAIEASLGAPVEHLFDAFEWEPVAAASIGQVHRARFDGRDVAVKVQYPRVAESLASDLAPLGRLSSLASLASAVDGRALVEELSERFAEECDYEREARAQQAFARAFADDPDVRVPEVVPQRCGAGVLTTAWVDGDTLAALEAQLTDPAALDPTARANGSTPPIVSHPAADPLDPASRANGSTPSIVSHPAADPLDPAQRDRIRQRRDAIAATLVRFAYRSLLQLGALQADPHPGNYLLPRGARPGLVAFLDFGCVRALDLGMVQALRAVAASIRDDDRPRFREAVNALGVVGRPSRFDYDHFFMVMEHLHRPLLAPHFIFDVAYVREGYAYNGPRSPNARTIAMPPAYIWVARLQWGLWSVLARLRAEGCFRDLLDELLAGPITPLSLDAAAPCPTPADLRDSP